MGTAYRAPIGIAVVVGLLTWRITDPPLWPSDFQFWHLAARLWLGGADPYAMRPHTPQWPLWDRFFYPGPALVLATPFSWLPLHAAHVTFVALAAGLLAWRLGRDARWPLLLFASPSFFFAALLGQWSPWLTLAALAPSAGFLLAAKPTLGLACWLYRPSWRAVWTGLAIVALSLVLMPSWPAEWLDNLHHVRQHPAPITYQWGPLLALAVIRWRTRDARFLLAMACVPQLLFFADQLPLLLLARTRGEALAFVVWGWLVVVAYLLSPGGVRVAAPWALLACYLPSLLIVLRRPNVADARTPQPVKRD